VVSGGAERLAGLAFHLSELATRQGVQVEVATLDLTNAFNTVERNAVIRAVARRAPFLLKYVVSILGEPSRLRVVGAERAGEILEVWRGTAQGDPLSPLLFSLVLRDEADRHHCLSRESQGVVPAAAPSPDLYAIPLRRPPRASRGGGTRQKPAEVGGRLAWCQRAFGLPPKLPPAAKI